MFRGANQSHPRPVIPAFPSPNSRRGKYRVAALVAVACLLQVPAGAQSVGCPGQSAPYVNYDREAITVSSTAVGFTAAKIANDAPGPGNGPVQMVVVTLETNPIRISTDGLAPSATVGELYTNSTNVKFMVCGQLNIQRFLAIRTGSDAAITAVYYRGQ